MFEKLYLLYRTLVDDTLYNIYDTIDDHLKYHFKWYRTHTKGRIFLSKRKQYKKNYTFGKFLRQLGLTIESYDIDCKTNFNFGATSSHQTSEKIDIGKEIAEIEKEFSSDSIPPPPPPEAVVLPPPPPPPAPDLPPLALLDSRTPCKKKKFQVGKKKKAEKKPVSMLDELKSGGFKLKKATVKVTTDDKENEEIKSPRMTLKKNNGNNGNNDIVNQIKAKSFKLKTVGGERSPGGTLKKEKKKVEVTNALFKKIAKKFKDVATASDDDSDSSPVKKLNYQKDKLNGEIEKPATSPSKKVFEEVNESKIELQVTEKQTIVI